MLPTMNYLKLFLATAGLLLNAVVRAGPLPSNAGMARQVLTIDHKVSETGEVSVSANVAPLVNSTRGFGTNVMRSKVRLPQAIGAIASVSVTAGSAQSKVMATAISHFKAHGPGLAAGMEPWMKAHGVPFAWYSYEQKVRVAVPNPSTGGGTTEERLLVWTMSTDQDGRLMFGNPQLVTPKPKTLYVVYTPLKVDDSLPSDWAYPNAGTLFVQTRDESFLAMPGTDQRIDVLGAFDEPVEEVAAGESPEAAAAFRMDGNVPCLMDHSRPGCTNTISVRSLMDERGAYMAVVDYMRKVQPVYDESPVGSGNFVPRTSLVVSERKISYDGCASATYFNRGSYGFELQSRSTRFLVSVDGQFGPVGEAQKTEQSQPERMKERSRSKRPMLVNWPDTLSIRRTRQARSLYPSALFLFRVWQGSAPRVL